MPGDSGRGNSFGMSFIECARYGYYKHVLGVVRPGPPPVAPHVGTAAHAYFDTVFKMFDQHATKEDAKLQAMIEFERVLDSGDDGLDQTELENRAGKARMDILPVWFENQWDKLERKVEVTIATEIDFVFFLPPEFRGMPICRGSNQEACEAQGPEHKAVCLRRVTGRIDRVCQRNTDVYEEVDQLLNDANPLLSRNGLSIQDFKTTSARSLKTYVADYLRSDQHLIYCLGWNRAAQYGGGVNRVMHQGHGNGDVPFADEILYSMVRIDPSIKSISAMDFHDEPRLVQEVQLDDCYERLCALRAMLTAKWHEPPVMWTQNTSPSGPCNKFGHPCEFNQLCDQPGEWDKLIAPPLTECDHEEQAAYDYHLDPPVQPV